jgi:predicted unusual protein kinase regulating ubiquinone biosynthesis (AarF/ABC1/UbiB family)
VEQQIEMRNHLLVFLLTISHLFLPNFSKQFSVTIKFNFPQLRRNRSSQIPESNSISVASGESIGLLQKRYIRGFWFWSRAVKIYTSYKQYQIKLLLRHSLQKLRNSFIPKSIHCNEAANLQSEQEQSEWDQLHDINSDRMLNICLTLRGFYLKAGQFLGTRHDFMPNIYLQKLSNLHDNIPPMNASLVETLITAELPNHFQLQDMFLSINLTHPIGSASIAQVHEGIWKATGGKVAIKIQNFQSQKLMISDLRNLRVLAEFLQRFEIKFDILSAIKELQQQIQHEFNFCREAKYMQEIGEKLTTYFGSSLVIPTPLYVTPKLLVMSFVNGVTFSNLLRQQHRSTRLINEKQQIASNISEMIPLSSSESRRKKNLTEMLLSKTGIQSRLQHRLVVEIFSLLAQAYAVMIFQIKCFHADPHPGNLCLIHPKILSGQHQKQNSQSSLNDQKSSITKHSANHTKNHNETSQSREYKIQLGLLDWGQVKDFRLHKQSLQRLHTFCELIHQLAHYTPAVSQDSYSNQTLEQETTIARHFLQLGIKVKVPTHIPTVAALARLLFDTQDHPNYVIEPFQSHSILQHNSIVSLPHEWYFLIRSVQLLRGVKSGLLGKSKQMPRSHNSPQQEPEAESFSLAKMWEPYAITCLNELELQGIRPEDILPHQPNKFQKLRKFGPSIVISSKRRSDNKISKQKISF